jgi:predicted carbohydrate-binding protein with CBM5 and CBM33 domain
VRPIRRLAALSATALLATGLAVAIAPSAAQAHGVSMFPAARTFMCYQDGLQPSGNIVSSNPACAAAVAATGTTPLYNWFAVLRSDAGGRTTGFIPDGQICSGGTGGPFDFTAYNAARTDWPLTHLTSGASYQFHYSNWAAHPGAFNLYITRDGWSPTTPLAWADLVPFGSVTNPPASGGPGALNYYFWDQQLPAKTGRHIIYIQWVRSDSQENFFSCSDVVFDGGNGEVTGVGSGATQPPGSTQPPVTSRPPSTTPPISSRPPTTTTRPPTTTTQPPGNGACSASFHVTSAWSGNFQGEVTVTAGSAAVNGWTVNWTNPSGQSLSQLWGGVLTQSGSSASVKPAAWNGSIAAGGTTTFGFLSTTSGTPALTGLSCTSP